MDTAPLSFEQRAHDLLEAIDARRERQARWSRPFMVELFGTPKAGKTTVKEMLKHFFRRNGWAVSTPTEGAEVVELPRDEPQYNFQTCEYALGVARDRAYAKNFHLVIFDRAVMDGVVRMDYYVRKGILTEEQRRFVEGYYLLPWNAGLFDLHVCLVASPEVAIARELARVLTRRHGETMNPKTLANLLAAHERVFNRLASADPGRFLWHDSSVETEEQTASLILTAVFDAFTARLAAQ